MEFILTALGFLVFGFLLATLFLYPFLKARFDAQVAESVRQSSEQAAQDALRRSSATIKGQLGERFAPFFPGFGYKPADARFLGNPIDYIVFDGLTDGQIRGIAFVEVKTGAAALTPYQRQVHEVIKARHIDWRVVEMPG
jgi:predicted Holliday junction resolvase-like endonuclease